MAIVARVGPDRLTYVGELWAVTVADGDGDRFVEVSPVVLGVGGGLGLVTAEDRAELEAGTIYREPRAGQRVELVTVWYHRPRPSGRWWYHETPRAFCVFDGEGPDGLPFVWLDSRGSVACGVDDFICG